jgi:hypothetical protein
MKKSMFILSLLIPGFVALTGCRSDYDHGAYLPVNTLVNNVETTSPVVLLDPAVQYSVACPAIQETHLSDGRLQVVASLRNRENRRIQVQVNCIFKDAQGFSTGDEAPFQSAFLDENASDNVRFTSMSDKAQGYTIHVRQAR